MMLQSGWRCLLAVVLLLVSNTHASARQVASQENRLDNTVQKLTSAYMSNAELAQHLEDFNKRCSSISRLHIFGKSVRGVPLIALEISDQPGVDGGKPEVKYAANIHGDEPSGRQLLLLLAETLCAEYKQANSPAAKLVSSIRLFLIPTLNPDGFARRTRNNENNIDLNRNFPDPIHDKGVDLRMAGPAQQPEVLAIMNFTLAHRFVASLSLHEGAIVANYPWDGYTDGSEAVRKAVHATPDDATFRLMSSTYAHLHAYMSDSPEFPGGITNGAQWYPLYGGMQDWNYLAGQCMEVTLELNNDKHPPPARLAQMWTENAQALLQWPLQTVLKGLQGRVVGRQGQPVGATLSIKENGALLTASPTTGHFARALAPGTYTVTVKAPGYATYTTHATVPKDAGNGVQLMVELQPDADTRVQDQSATPASGATKEDAQQQDKQRRDDGDQQTEQMQSEGAGQADGVVRIVDNGSSMQGGVGMSSSLVWALAVGVPLVLGVAYVVMWRRQQQTAVGFPRPAGYQSVPRSIRPPANAV